MASKIEHLAKFLLSKKVSFEYSRQYLRVTDVNFAFDVCENATYHTDNGRLIILNYDGEVISFNEVERRTKEHFSKLIHSIYR